MERKNIKRTSKQDYTVFLFKCPLRLSEELLGMERRRLESFPKMCISQVVSGENSGILNTCRTEWNTPVKIPDI